MDNELNRLKEELALEKAKRRELESLLQKTVLPDADNNYTFFNLIDCPVIILKADSLDVKYINPIAGKFYSIVSSPDNPDYNFSWLNLIQDIKKNFRVHSEFNFGDYVFSVSGYLLKDTNDIFITGINITEYRNKELSLRASRLQYKNLVENASDIIYHTDELGYFTYVNPKAISLTGYSKEELLGKRFINRPQKNPRAPRNV